MASATTILKLLPDYLKKRNVLEVVAMNAIQGVYNLITYMSRRKLLKYNLLLAQEKLGKLEGALGPGSPYAVHGQKINKLR